MRTGVGLAGTAAVLALAAGSPAAAWLTEGHRELAAAAVTILPERVPAFFRYDPEWVGRAAIDPDLEKLYDTPALRDGEYPEHYLDVEYLGESRHRLPATRYEYLRLLDELDLDAYRVGLLPYALVEGTERLAVHFAEHRRWPGDRRIRAKIRQQAGRLAHYAADLCQPLHTTRDYDGRVGADGSSPRSGIHRKVDGLFDDLPDDPGSLLEEVEPTSFAALLPEVMAAFDRSHRLVDRVYALEPRLEWPADGAPAAEVVAFAEDRYRAAVGFVASLFLSAWDLSEKIELPGWLEGSL